MLDLLIHNASLPDGRKHMSVAVRAGRIVEVAAGLQAPAHETVDAQGQLLSPPFIDAHFHMDATLSYGLPRVNASGTLLEGIAVWGELKPMLTQEALMERALAYCDWAVAKGLLAIRTHVDVCDPRLLAVDALLEVKRRVAPYIDLQLVAFPQDGVLRGKTGPQEHMDTLKRALDRGVDVVGGIPHFERTMADGALSVKLLCELAAERGLRWTCTATSPTTRTRATSKPWPLKPSAWVCRGASPARTSAPCTAWTTTMSANSYR